MKIYKKIAAILALSMACTAITVPAFADDENAASKDETVYIIENVDGSAEKIIVSDTFANVSADEAMEYLSELSDLQQVSENNWQGTSEKELPINIKATYTLDGEEILPEELAGKSGHVVIRFDYSNNMKINEEIYIPFIAATGLYLDNDVFSNIEVTNGVIYNDGNRTAIAGLAFPGLKEDLTFNWDSMKEQIAEKFPDKDFDPSDLNIPDYFEISADVDNFELATAITLVANIKKSDDGTYSVDNLKSCITDLTNAMAELSDGASAIYDGLDTLLTSCTDLSDGITQINDGLTTLTDNNESLVAGAETVFITLLAQAYAGISEAGLTVPELTIENYSETLDTLAESLKNPDEVAAAKAREQVEAAVMEQEETIRAAVTEAVMSQAAEQMSSEDITATIDNNVKAQIASIIEEKMNSDEVKTQISAAAEAITAGAAQIAEVKAQLDSYNEFYTGLKNYTEGVSSVKDGVATINTNMPELIEGVTQLKDGAQTLSDALTALKDIADTSEIEIDAVLDRVDAALQASNEYTSYTENAAGIKSEVKFIYRMNAIE